MVVAKDSRRRLLAPDPVVGVGLVIFGVFVMGVAGAATWHYAFNVGTLFAILGALWFVVSVTLSTIASKRLGPHDLGPGDGADV
ncbi:MAG TPA: hypothetical protein VL400_20790 [Polyangiaceae bacterium]|jgi:hypothetical protein|nr:hypothetical protein [Polyangiaceae bacterium]